MSASVTVMPATEADAAEMLTLTRAVFGAYADLEPQPSSLHETVDEARERVREHGGLVVREATTDDSAGRLVAVTWFAEHEGGFWLRRVAVHPDLRRQGLATRLIERAEAVARERGYAELRVGVRRPLTGVARFWRARGFVAVTERDHWVEMRRPLPVRLSVPTAGGMAELGRRLAPILRAGDLVVLTGDLGAGKTTLTQGLGAGLGVRGAVTSPTFVISRVHRSAVDGPALVHADAYRLGSLAEVDDLDLDASLDESVTVVEWGGGKVEDLAESRLEVALYRSTDPDEETRSVVVRGFGARWLGVDLEPLGRDDAGR